MAAWTVDDVAPQNGRTFLVTGSNTGIGFAAAHVLARKGAHVILACRSAQKGQAAIERIRREVPAASVELLSLDLADLASVRQAAEQVLQRHDRLDVLINNAGLMMPPLSRTADGFELQFGTNVLGHFAFTGLLLPLIDKTPQARIVSQASVAHWDGRIDFDNLNAERGYNRWRAYAQSKLANLMFAYELERRLRRTPSGTISLCAHPGGTQSELQRNNGALQLVSAIAGRFMLTAEGGALPALRAAVDPAARGGEYYGPSQRLTFYGPPSLQRSSKRSHDEAVAAGLWQECERLTGVRYL